ncbi:MAG TPA: winged helix-turn-helix domain-containing protein [Bryobacteraceae bacterium]|nr:winged helix-turn-helix domain-containing protein [Bryobacteraceae bacterium]
MTMLRIGDWCVNPKSGQISRNGETARLEERTMRLLLCLAEHAGEVVSIDDLLNHVWSGVIVAPDSVYQGVATLRRQLGDDPKQPTYIATVPRLGYRMVATVSPWADHSIAQSIAEPAPRLRWGARAALCLALVAALLVIVYLTYSKVANRSALSIAVLPFRDLTDAMNHEAFADGMTEELIDKFSKIPGLRVPAPRSSFLLKGKKMPIAEVAKTLGVTYVLDGSVRKAGSRVRVAARLIRADNGYVVWSETYDRPSDDLLRVQDDIAGEVTKALRASIESRP